MGGSTKSRSTGNRVTFFSVLVLGIGSWVLASGCGSPPPVELPHPDTGRFLTLEEQRLLSKEQIDEYCLMLNDHLAQIHGDIELAYVLVDSLTAVNDSLSAEHSRINRETRLLERELKKLKSVRAAGTEYLTKEGDTLMKIANLFYGTAADWRKIYDENRDQIADPRGELAPGLKLHIPQ